MTDSDELLILSGGPNKRKHHCPVPRYPTGSGKTNNREPWHESRCNGLLWNENL